MKEGEPKLLGEEIISQQGSFSRVRRWYSGHHPELGILTTKGLTGNETIVEEDVIKPVVTIEVVEPEKEKINT